MRLLATWILLILAAGVTQAQDVMVVLVQFDEAPAPGVVEAVHEELDELFGAAGLGVSVRQIVTRPLRGRKERAAVVHFSNPCVAPPAITKRESSVRTLAYVHRAGRRILDLIEVDCAAVSRYIASGLNSEDIPRIDALYRRALARVVAHELLHWAMNEKRHTTSPLFRQRVEASHLLADGVRLGEEELSRLRRITVDTIAGGL